MLSSEGPGNIFQEDNMQDILQDASSSNTNEITQPKDGVYYFPTLLTNIQKDIIELCIKIFGNEFIKEIYQKNQRTKIHSLLGSDEDKQEEGNDDNNFGATDNQTLFKTSKLSFNEKLEFIFGQIEIATNHPNLLVDHFLPKKLLLLEINERLVNMSGKFLLFNKIVDALLQNFLESVKYSEIPVYNILVVSESVKELELIEGLIIGKDLYYNNVSTLKLYDDNQGIPPNFNKTENPNNYNNHNHSNSYGSGTPSDTETKERRSRKRSYKVANKYKPVICLHLITTLQLYNNCTSILDSGYQFKMIYSFDNYLDSKCASIDMIRNQSQPVYENNAIQTPIIIPIPIYSLNHIQTLINRPVNYQFNRSEKIKWKSDVLTALIYNRYNISEEQETNFFVDLYGRKMEKFYNWFLDWDSVKFPLLDDEFMGKFTDKLNLNLSIHEEKLIKRINNLHLLPINGSQFNEKFELDVFDYKTFKVKFTELLTKRFQQVNSSISNLQENVLPNFRQKETSRQIDYDKEETSVAENYRKLRRLNEDATFVEKKLIRIENDFNKQTKDKGEVEDKINHLENLIKTEGISEKLTDQAKLIEELSREQSKLKEELEKISSENEELRTQYRESSNEALLLSVTIQKWKENNTKIENKSNGPGVKILPSLIKKDDLINHEQTLQKITNENKFLQLYFEGKLDKLITERKSLMDQSGTTRNNNRVSRASTPY